MGRIFPIVFLLMSLAVATREIPELWNLADDPSNDGQVFYWQGQAPRCNKQGLKDEKGVPRARLFSFAHSEEFICASIVPARTGQDILRLVVSLRT